MNKIITFVMILMMSNISFAECDWSTITKVDSRYSYSVDCHKEVGKLVKEQELRREQVVKLNKTISLKDLSISKAEERITNWRDTTYILEKRLQTQRKWSRYNDWMYFGGGIFMTVLAGWTMGQVNK